MRKLAVALTVCTIALAASLVGHVKAQSSVKKFGQTTGIAADEAKAFIMQMNQDKAAVLGNNIASSDFFDKTQADDALIIDGDGSLESLADRRAKWQSLVMTQQSETTTSPYKIDVYDNGNVAVETYISTIHLTRDGKPQVHVSRVWNALVKQDGKWLVVVHGVSRKGA